MSATAVTNESLAHRIARMCLHLSIAVVPFVTTSAFLGDTRLGPHFVDGSLPKLSALQVFVFAGLTAWAIALLRSEVGLRWHRLGWIGVAYVAWTGLSAVMGSSVAVGVVGQHGRLQGLLAVVAYLGALFLALQLVDSSARVREFARTLAVTGAALATYGLLQSAGLDPFTWSVAEFDRGMAFATFGNPDVLGGYLIAPLGAALGLFFSARGGRESALYGVCGMLIAAGIVATFVRGAWLAAVVVVLVFGVAAWRARMRIAKSEVLWLAGVALVLAGIVGVSVVFGGADTNALQRVVAAFDTDSGSVGARFLIWETAVEAVPETWLTGEGPDQFTTAFTRHEDPRSIAIAGSPVFADNAHNVLLQLAVTVGIPGAMLFLALVVAIVVAAIPIGFSVRGDRRFMVFSGVCAAVIGYGVYLLSGLEQPASMSVLWILLAALLSPTAGVVAQLSRQWRAGVLAVIVVVSAGFVGHAAVRLVAENAYSKASQPMTSLPIATRLAERAVALAPWEPEYRRGYAMVMRRVVDAGQGSGLALTPEAAVKRGEVQLAAATAISPADFRNPLVLGGLYLSAASAISTSYAAQAADAASEAIRLRPASPEGYNQLALARARSGDTEAATAAARRSVELWDGYADGWVVLALLLEQSGETAGAAEAYRSALETLPQGDPRRAAVEGALRELQ